ncbi:hypothetical protein SDC9_156861 [bioreactor metagenome]|uniref:Uncharacterized protein n=1 Tax=bioreactor metagenome TaxID=1076179 RepID=A0A645F6R2_9ZZZZ
MRCQELVEPFAVKGLYEAQVRHRGSPAGHFFYLVGALHHQFHGAADADKADLRSPADHFELSPRGRNTLCPGGGDGFGGLAARISYRHGDRELFPFADEEFKVGGVARRGDRHLRYGAEPGDVKYPVMRFSVFTDQSGAVDAQQYGQFG